MQWTSINDSQPSEEVLIFTKGGCRIAVLVKDPADNSDVGDFMDPKSGDLLPWPTHWMPLPSPPSSLMILNDDVRMFH
ncbi:DUF551 domain-containing protein [Sphingosinicella sp. CPCC 101087]|uniref:DUF551 domain-containing protein n=1 Tax=Sphingosinicella sp. CPCC 101087 TaxID=2497754 RepID=UPI0013EC3CB2